MDEIMGQQASTPFQSVIDCKVVATLAGSEVVAIKKIRFCQYSILH